MKMSTELRIEPLHPLFAARVTGVDLSTPVPAEQFDAIQAAFAQYGILVFPGQNITDDQQVAFSERFGPLEPLANYSGPNARLKAHISDLSNLDAEGKIWDPTSLKRMFNLANMLWHTDSSFKPIPALCSMLSAREVPPVGGETEFTDLRAVYEALDPALRERIAELRVEHDIFHSRAQVGYTSPDPQLTARFPPVTQRLVRTHFPSGRRTLYLASHCSKVVGWPEDEGRKLLQELMAFATQPRFVYQHRWTQFDLVLWDNRCTMHRGREYDDLTYTRDMRRTTVSEHASSLEQEPALTAPAVA
jgi:alpha-ketoglutarate-dependent 2,4-dichlorophenoxyacetate dioxygenase